MKKALLFPFLLALAVCGFYFGGILFFGVAEAGTDVTGIITSSTAWTKANSPYTLTGPVAVNVGVTLTIEAGVSVNLNNFYVQVNGTLIVNGSDTDKITFTNGQITFTPVSVGWNETTGSGCIIENAILNSTGVSSSNPLKVSNSTTNRSITVGNSSVISYNNLTGSVTLAVGDASVVTNNMVNNTIRGGRSVTVINNTVRGGGTHYPAYSGGTINAEDGSLVSDNNVDLIGCGYATILNNTVYDRILSSGTIFNNTVYGCYIAPHGNETIITYNTLYGGGMAIEAWEPLGSVTVSHNIIPGNIYLSGDGYVKVSDNNISGANTLIYLGGSYTATIENNIITCRGGGDGIKIGTGMTSITATIRNNTISSFNTGILGGLAQLTIVNNTITSCNVGIDGNYGANKPSTIVNNTIAFNNVGISSRGTSTIANNIIVSNNVGISLIGAAPPIVFNTFAFNKIGIGVGSSSQNVFYNNFQDTSGYNIHLGSGVTGDVNVTNNWWGTTDTQAINQSIWDFKNDFNLGKANFVPFLTAPNPAAPTIPTLNILASAETGGSINPSGSVSVSYGGNQTFTITADTGYYIADVTVDGNSTGAVSAYNFTYVQTDHTISATFETTPTPTPSPSSTPTPTPSPTPTPTASPSPSPSSSASPEPTATPTPTPTSATSPTPTPTSSPTTTPSSSSSPQPTATASPTPQPDTGINLPTPLVYAIVIAFITLIAIITALIIKIKRQQTQRQNKPEN